MSNGISTKTIREPAREINVCREADVVVVGGGPGGFAAALAAARSGADTVLIERYGCLGGMATGGLVTIIPNLTNFDGKQYINGICGEWVDKMDALEATGWPAQEHLGVRDKKLAKEYFDRTFFYVRQDTIIKSVLIDAEVSKCLINDLVEEAGVKTYLHSWGTAAVVDGNEVQGVIFESKSGRQAVLAKVTIDATGDGDLLPSAGATFDVDINPKLRIANLSLCYWIANVDLKKAEDFKQSQPEKFAEMRDELLKMGAHPNFIKSNLKNQDSIVWIHPRYPVSSQIDVEELTRVEFLGRKKMTVTHEFYKKRFPGFENSFVVLSEPQIGTRGARRVHGEITLTGKDMDMDTLYDDTIAIFPDLDRGEASEKLPLQNIPYRCMVPLKVENLLVACRAFSSDDVFNTYFNLIPHCVALGEAAGTAAALAIKEGSTVRKVNIGALQARLAQQNVTLPAAISR
jgi:hypothetical protein